MTDITSTRAAARRDRDTAANSGAIIPAPRQPVGVLAPAGGAIAPSADRVPTQIRSLRGVIRLVFALDAVMIAAGLALAWPLRDLVPGAPLATPDGIVLAALLAPVLWALWVSLLAGYGAYARRTFGAGAEEFAAIVKATTVAGFAASTACYFTELPLSRGFLACAFVLGVPLLLAERYVVRKWIHRRRLDGVLVHRVLAVGSRRAVTDLARTLERERYLGFELVGCTLTDPGRTSVDELPAPMVGSMHDVSTTCTRLGADTVMVAGGADLQLREVAWNLEGQEVDLIVVPDLADVSGPRMKMRPVAGLPLLHVEEPQAGRAASWPKRVFDVVGAAFGLLLISPVLLVTALLIKLDDGGPVFYKQYRVGLNGEMFGCFKFRSMSVDADRIEAQLRAQTGHEGALFKLEKDPRITRIGAFIRRYSIDELPQLLNVVNGTMSLVGPRPQQQWEVDTYNDQARRRLHVRPGMTGLWQVSGRSNLSWDDAIRLDLYYRDNWSLVSDFVIIAKTVRAVLGKDGAY